MGRILLWFWLLVKRQLKSPAMLIFLIGIPLVSFLVTRFPAFNENSVVRVALCSENDDEIAESVIEQLVSGNYAVEFYRAAGKEQMVEAVMSQSADHGYYFTKNFTDNLKNSAYEESIVIFSNSSGFLEAVTKEVVFSEVFKKLAGQIAIDYIRQDDMFYGVRDEAVSIIEKRYEEYSKNGQTFYIDFDTVDEAEDRVTDGVGVGAVDGEDGEDIDGAADGAVGENGDTDKQGGSQVVRVETEKSGTAFPIRGVLGVMVFVAGLYGGVWWLSEKKKSVCAGLPQNTAMAGGFIYITVPTVLFALSAEVALAVTGTGVYPYEFLKMFIYVATIVLWVRLFTAVVRSPKIMVTAIPVFAIASLVICPVFVNLAAVIPAVEYISRLLLPYYYMI